MNICYLADARAEHTRRWAKYFALKGHRVDVITLNPNILDGYEPVRVHLVRKPITASGILALICNLPPILIKIKRILRDIRPDVLHAHSAGGYAWLAMLTGFNPYVVTPWGTDVLIDAKASRLNRLFTTMALRRADLITTDGYHVKEEMVRLRISEDKIRMVFFGTDVTRFSPRKADDVELRRRYGLDDSPIVISTRTLTPVHDVGTLVHAVPIVKRAIPNVTIVIAGDGSERKNLERLIETLGIRDSVRFVGRVEEDEMVMWLRVADVYVSTSLADAGLAASTAEAMACGLPVVITDNADNRKWVEDGVGGFLVPNGAFEIIADRVICLLRDKEMRLEFGRRNRQVIEERNNYVTEMNKMEDIYEELARRAR